MSTDPQIRTAQACALDARVVGCTGGGESAGLGDRDIPGRRLGASTAATGLARGSPGEARDD